MAETSGGLGMSSGASTPFSPPDGSGALRQACQVVRGVSKGDGSADLDKVFAFGFGDEGLQLGSCEGIDKTSLRNDKKQDLCAGKD